MSVNFKQQCKPISGKIEWISNSEADKDDLRLEIAKSNYAGMLHDTERNEKYRRAIDLAMKKLLSNGNNDIHTLDIGTGTGILAMMSAKAGSHYVTACEVFKPMARIAEKIITSNKLDQTVSVINKRSTEMELNPLRKADLLVTEIFDTELIGEGVLPTLRDAHERLLKPSSIVVPSKAQTYIQLIQSDFLFSMKSLENFNEIELPQSLNKCLGLANPLEIQINKLYPDKIKLVTKHTLLKEFDFEKPFHHNVNMKSSSTTVSVIVQTEGVIHAVLFWWDLILNEKENIVLSMKPDWVGDENEESFWRDHWMQAVYYLQQPLKCAAEDVLHVTMFHDDYSVWFDVNKTPCTNVERPMCSCFFHVGWSKERFLMFNNCASDCWKTLSAKCEDLKGTVSIIGDCSLLPLHLAKNHEHLKFLYFDTSYFQKNIKSLIQLNNLNNIELVNEIEKLDSTFVMCDPYFSSSLLPWHHLRITNYFSQIDSPKIPMRACLKACVVAFKDLWKVRAPVKSIDEFDLTCFDELIANALEPIQIGKWGAFECVEPFSVWEFDNSILSDTRVIASFNIDQALSKFEIFHADFHSIRNHHLANAVVIWLDFLLDDKMFLATGLSKQNEWVTWSRQGVYFLRKKLGKNNLHGNIVYKPNDEEFMFSFS